MTEYRVGSSDRRTMRHFKCAHPVIAVEMFLGQRMMYSPSEVSRHGPGEFIYSAIVKDGPKVGKTIRVYVWKVQG